jgi:hypothetical protein
MANKIILKHNSGTTAKVPGTLDKGEVAVDQVSKKLYVGDGTNNFEFIDKSAADSAYEAKDSTIVKDANYVHTDNNYTNGDVAKVNHLTVTKDINLDDVQDQLSGLSAAVVLKGDWDASTGSFPSDANTGFSYIVNTAGTVDGVDFSVNDRVIALVDNASTSTYADNWLKLDYTDQVLSVAGKTGNVTLTKSDVGLSNVDNTADADKTVAKADKLTTARTIALSSDVTGSASFDGSSNITISATVDSSFLKNDSVIDGGTY